MKNRTYPPIAQWLPLARQYATTHGADLSDGLLYVGRSTDKADVTTGKPGQTYAQLVENPIGDWHWEEHTIQPEANEEPTTDYDAQDHHEVYQADDCYA